MDKSKVIQVIHAADAEQHLGYLKKILDGLKAEDRITSYSSLESSTINETTFANFGADDMVIMLLTNAIVEHKATLEQWLLDLKKQNPQSKIAEVLVDNVPYETKLAVLPENLQPIRASEDMDGAWERIAESLKKLFPKPEIDPVPPPPPPPPPRKKWWKYFLIGLGILALIILAFLGIKQCSGPNLEVGRMAVRAIPASNVSQNCPEQIEFVAQVRTKGSGQIQYRWINSDGTKTNPQSVAVNDSETLELKTTWKIGSPGQTITNKWQQLEIISPTKRISNKATFKLQCQTSTTSGINIDFRNRGASRIINSNAFLQEGIRAVRAKPVGSYCNAARPAILARGTSNAPHSFLSTANPANLNSCHGIVLEFDFTRTVRSVTVLFHGAAVDNKLTAYKTSGATIGSRSAQAVPYNYTQPFKVTYTSSSVNISRITFGYQAATTHIIGIIAQ